MHIGRTGSRSAHHCFTPSLEVTLGRQEFTKIYCKDAQARLSHSTLDIRPFLEPVSDVSPCGSDPVYDEQYLKAFRLAERTPELRSGDEVIAAVPPNWAAAREAILQVLAEHRDLRAAVLFARCELALEGWSGFRDAMELIAGLLREFWDDVHPGLDREDNDDPTMRCNALAALNDRGTMIAQLRSTPLVKIERIGSFSIRDIEAAAENKEGAASPTTIDDAFRATDRGQLAETLDAIRQSRHWADEIKKTFDSHVGQSHGIAIDLLCKTLNNIADQIAGRISPSETSSLGECDVGDVLAPDDSVSTISNPTVSATSGIASRADVVRSLDLICKYYEKHEPASPLPLLLQRAKRLVDKNFLDIVRDLLPDSVSQAEHWQGASNAGSDEVESDNDT